MRNVELQGRVDRRATLIVTFRIPNSALRILADWSFPARYGTRAAVASPFSRAPPPCRRRSRPGASTGGATVGCDRAVRRQEPRTVAVRGQHVGEMGRARRLLRGGATHGGDRDEARLRRRPVAHRMG